jgi:hypothetical protein
MIRKIRGFRIELGEIEAGLGEHPAVRAAAVLAREDTSGDPSDSVTRGPSASLRTGKRLVAYVVLKQGQTENSNALRSFLKEKLPEYMVPSAFVLLDELPLTPNGKVDRRALMATDPTKPGSGKVFVAPRTPTEEMRQKSGPRSSVSSESVSTTISSTWAATLFWQSRSYPGYTVPLG